MALSAERQKFLQEMAEVVVGEAIGMSVDPDGVIVGTHGKWIPVEEQAGLEGLFAAMKMVGLEPSGFRFQQYKVLAANPGHGGRVDLEFPDQLVIKGLRYEGMHQANLVVKNPFITAHEIRSYSRTQ